MPRYIDADALEDSLIERYCDICKGACCALCRAGYIFQEIKSAPAADVEPVVRCRDCRFAHMTYDGECKYCDCFANKDEDGELNETLYLDGDFFCAFGKRKEADDAEVH